MSLPLLLLLIGFALLGGGAWYLSGRLQARALDFPEAPPPGASQRDAYPFLAVYYTLLLKVAQVDGHVSTDELTFARRHLRKVARTHAQETLSEEDLDHLEATILARGHELTLDETARFVRQQWDALGRDNAAAFYPEALTALASLAAADGTLRQDEDLTLERIATQFGFSDATYADVRARVVQELRPVVEADPPPPAEEGFDARQATDAERLRHYGALLGLSGRVARTDIRRRYRDLLTQYHPDKVATLGPELQALAEQKTKELNEAYAWLAQRFNL